MLTLLAGLPGMIASIVGNISLIQATGIIITLAGWFYYYMTRNMRKFERQGIFTTRPKSLIFGHNHDLFLQRKSMNDLYIGLYQEHKNHGISIFYEGTEPVFFVTDPKLIQQIQCTDFDHFMDFGFFAACLQDAPENSFGLASSRGQEWRNFKAAVTPAFRLKNMKNVSVQINNCAQRFVDFLQKSDKPVDMRNATELFTMDCIASLVLSINVDPYNNPKGEFIKNGRGLLVEWRFLLASFAPKLMSIFSMTVFGPKSYRFFQEFIERMRKERMNMANPPMDVLGIMLKGQQNNSTNEHKITDKMLVDTVTQFFMDGFTTVALFLQFNFYFLACCPEVQERAYQEVEEFAEKYGNDVNKDNVEELQYLDQVMLETGRMAPFGLTARLCTKPWKIPGKDVIIPKDYRLYIPLCATQMDEDYFPNPDIFDPDRFSPENKKNIVPGTYQPWGNGPRQCIGMQIARMEARVLLYNTLRKFKVEKTESTIYPLKWSPKGFLEIEGGVNLNFVPRQ